MRVTGQGFCPILFTANVFAHSGPQAGYCDATNIFYFLAKATPAFGPKAEVAFKGLIDECQDIADFMMHFKGRRKINMCSDELNMAHSRTR